MTPPVVGGVSTVGAALLAWGLGILHPGSPAYLALTSLVCLILALSSMAWARRTG